MSSITPDSESTNIFISYTYEDRKKAEKLYRDLNKAGFKPWVDFNTRALSPGSNIALEIRRAIKLSDIFIILYSSHSIKKNRFVEKETEYALDSLFRPSNLKVVIPIRLENVPIDNKLLKNFRYIDLFPEEKWEEGVNQVIKIIKSSKNTSRKDERIFFYILIESNTNELEQTKNFLVNTAQQYNITNEIFIIKDDSHLTNIPDIISRDHEKDTHSQHVKIEIHAYSETRNSIERWIEHLNQKLGINLIEVSEMEKIS
jgi:hypothetical protein